MNSYEVMLQSVYNSDTQVASALSKVGCFFSKGNKFISDWACGTPSSPFWRVFVGPLSTDGEIKLINTLCEQGWGKVEVLPTTEKLQGIEDSTIVILYKNA